MARNTITTILKFIGLTADEKPTTGIPNGSEWKNKDGSKETFTFSDGVWIQDIDSIRIAAGENSIGTVVATQGTPGAIANAWPINIIDAAGSAKINPALSDNQGKFRNITDGLLYSYLTVAGKPRYSSMPYLYDVSEGNITGHTPWSKLAYNGDVGTSEEDIWTIGGTYIPPTAEMRMEVISSSADDDGSPLGTGAQQVKIWYLTSAFVEKTEIVTMNGTAAVATVATDIYRINNFRVYTCGSGGKAAGNIDIRHLSDTPIYGRIEAGYTNGRNSFYTVPTGKTLNIFNLLCSSGGTAKPVRFIARSTYDNLDSAIRTFFLSANEVLVTDTVADMPIELPTRFSAGVDIKVSVISNQAGALCSVLIRGWLETV